MNSELHNPATAKRIGLIALCAAICFSAPCANAAVVLGEFDWNKTDDLEGWTKDQTWTALAAPGPDGHGFMDINLDPTSPAPAADWASLVTVDATSLFAGNWNSSLLREFDFFAEDYTAGELQLQWQGASEYTWTYIINPSDSTGQWETYSASFANWKDWAVVGDAEEIYLADLSSIDWIGLYMYGTTDEPQGFGMDDDNLLIPEPSEYAIIAAVLSVMFIEVRRRRRAATIEVG